MIRRHLIIGCLVGLVLGGLVTTSHAHLQGNFYTAKWGKANTSLTQNWKFVDTFPTGSWRDRVSESVGKWNALNQPMNWVKQTQVANFCPPGPACGGGCPPAQKNTVHYRNIDGRDGTLAYVLPCTYTSNNEMSSATMVIDSSEDWYIGTGDAPDGTQVGGACINGPCQVDSLSVVTHEWGHASGHLGGPNGDGHYSPTDSTGACNDDSWKHTMCPSYGPKGDERQRTLEAHDIHTFADAY